MYFRRILEGDGAAADTTSLYTPNMATASTWLAQSMMTSSMTSRPYDDITSSPLAVESGFAAALRKLAAHQQQTNLYVTSQLSSRCQQAPCQLYTR